MMFGPLMVICQPPLPKAHCLLTAVGQPVIRSLILEIQAIRAGRNRPLRIDSSPTFHESHSAVDFLDRNVRGHRYAAACVAPRAAAVCRRGDIRLSAQSGRNSAGAGWDEEELCNPVHYGCCHCLPRLFAAPWD